MTDRHATVILDASPRTAFLYRMEGGMDERDRDEIESMDSGYVLGRNWPSIVSDSVDLRHRMGYIRNRNLGFGFVGLCDASFENGLTHIDPNLPVTLAYMVSDAYRDGTQRLSDLLENVRRRNPAGLKNIMETEVYRKMVTAFLRSLTDMGSTDAILLENCFFERVPADRFGCTSISGDKQKGFETKLILKIVYRTGFRA